MKGVRILLVILCLTAGIRLVPGAVLFQDNFSTDQSAQYGVIHSGADSTANFSFDYTGLQTADNGTGYPPVDIPPAPGAADKKALRLECDATAGVQQVIDIYPNTALPAVQDLAIEFDLFQRVNGVADASFIGGSGSSQRIIVGLNHSGTKTVNLRQTATPELPTDTDGYYFGIMGDGGFAPASTTARDYEFREGTSPGPASPTAACKWFGVDATDTRLDNTDPGFLALFPSPTAVPPGTFPYFALGGGAPGDNWVHVKAILIASGPTCVLYLNGTEVFRYTAATQANNNGGKALIALEDPTSSFAGAGNGYTLIDNLTLATIAADVPDWTLFN